MCLLSVNLGVLIGSDQGEKVVGLDWQRGPAHHGDDDDEDDDEDDDDDDDDNAGQVGDFDTCFTWDN